MLQVGSVVDRKYKILSEVGHGGMSVVYLAINERANKTWAIKEVRKDGVCDFEAVKQGLVAETDMLKRLNHPHMPSIIDVIDTEDSFLIVMDYIEGTSLQSVLKKSGAQPKDLVIEWGKQLCDVLGYLHSREPAIIYRDMKPSNVMLKPNGEITLIDFGTAREFKNRAMVEDTTCLGTRGYAAPEQFGGRGQTDARTDIYCLGATLYHLLTGHSPAEPPYEIKPLSYWDPSYAGSGLEMIINKCCQQDPAARYQSCAELMYDLEHEHEWDYRAQVSRRRKWNAFIASIALCLVGVVGMVGFSLAETNQTEAAYNQGLDEARGPASAEDFDVFVGAIKETIKLDPGRHEAYDLLLTRVLEDGKFDKQVEYRPINECLNDSFRSGDNKANERYLQEENLEHYADIQYRVGLMLFLMSSGEEENLRQAAAYFEKALVNGEMNQATDEATMQKARLAQSLQTIGEYVGSLDNIRKNPFLQAEHSYSDLWEDLNLLIQDNPIGSFGDRLYGIALYSRVANMVYKYHEDFLSESVRAEDMLALLDQMEAALNETAAELTSTEIKNHYNEEIDKAIINIGTARNVIESQKEGIA